MGGGGDLHPWEFQQIVKRPGLKKKLLRLCQSETHHFYIISKVLMFPDVFYKTVLQMTNDKVG